MSGFTPGPWEWREDDGMRRLAPGVLILDRDGGGPWGDEIGRANAALIAAAPDLYEALKEIVDRYEAKRDMTQEEGDAWYVRAARALTKAAGAP